MVHVLPIDTPTLGDRSYLVHDGRVAFVVDPQRDIDRVLDLAATRAGARSRTSSRRTSTTTTSPAACAGRRDRRGVPRQRRRPGDVRPGRGPRRRRRHGRRRDAGAGARHPGPHLHPPVLRARVRRPAGRRCSPAGRCCTGRPAAPTCSAPTTPTPWCTTSTPRRTGWPPSCPARPGSTRPTASAASARPPSPRPPPPPWPRSSALNPALTRDEQAYVDELLAGLDAWPAYYAHMGPANAAGPAAPDLSPPRPGRRRAAAPADRGRGVGGRPAQPDRLRRRARAGHAELRPRRAASPPTWAG